MEPSEETTYGVPATEVGPDGQEVAAGPHAYYTDTGSGGEAGIGLVSGPIGGGAEVDVLAANAHFGDGETTHGVMGEAAVASAEIAPGGELGPVGGSVEALTAEGSMYIGEDSASIGAGATLVGGSVAVGNQEHNAEVGLSAGVGLGGRAHYGDADSDGVNELGVGAEIGPVSVDVKSEVPHHVANAVGGAAGAAKDTIGGWLGF